MTILRRYYYTWRTK